MSNPRSLVRLVPFVALLPVLSACRASDSDAPQIVADTRALSETRLVAGLDAPLEPSANRLWCASLSFAWQALEREVGRPLHFDSAPPEVAWVAACPLHAEDLAPGSVFVSVGRGPQGRAQLREAAARAGSRAAADGLESFAPEPRPGGFLAYAFLEKVLPFEKRFDDLDAGPMTFTGAARTAAVDAFGLQDFDWDEKPEVAMAKQVRVHHYAAPDDFVFELVPKGAKDRVLVARLAPGATLRATWEAVRARLNAKPARLEAGDTLALPELDFLLTQDFDAFAGLPIDPAGTPDARWIERVRQDLRLRLDEAGVVVRSRSSFGVESAAPSPKPRRMVCDGPFFLATLEADDEEPYFAAWIATPELLLVDAGKER